MARKISKRQQQIYDFIRSYQKEKGISSERARDGRRRRPLLPSTVHAHLSALEDLGLIKRDATKPRALEVFNSDGSSCAVTETERPASRARCPFPLVGRVAAGLPILAEQNIEDTFTLPTEIATDSSSFMLEVHGESMINVGIYNGDYIVVREQKKRHERGRSSLP